MTPKSLVSISGRRSGGSANNIGAPAELSRLCAGQYANSRHGDRQPSAALCHAVTTASYGVQMISGPRRPMRSNVTPRYSGALSNRNHRRRRLRLMAPLIFVLIPVASAAASQVHPAHHYSYSGNNPAQWTTSVLAPREAAASADFTVFPCNAQSCAVARVVTDVNRNTYVVGSRYFQIPGTSPTSQASDVFIAKLDPSGATVFLATLSGKGSDQGSAIALDSAGNIFVGGSTTSPNFPLRNPIQAQPASGSTGFLVKLSPDGSQLIYSTYLSGTASTSYVNAVAVDSAGSAYVTGQTGSRDFSTTPGMPAGAVTGWVPGGTLGAFIAKLSAAGDKILYSRIVYGGVVPCIGGSSCFRNIRSISGNAIALDSAGNAYVAGNSNVTDLPTTEGVLARQGIGGWVARINVSGTKLDYLTYLGAARYGSGAYLASGTGVSGLAVDAAGNAYLVGSTSDPKFPVTAGALQSTYNGPANPPLPGVPPPSDAFVAKLNPQGTAMVYATFLGGSGDDAATGLALDSAGVVYVTGTTASSDFPITVSTSKGRDFIAVLNPAGSALSFSSRYPGGSVSQALAIDADGRVRAVNPTGIVSSLALNTPPGTCLLGIMSVAGGQLGPAVAPGEVVSLFGTQLGPANAAVALADSTGKMPTALVGTQVLFDGIAAPLLYVSQDQVNAVTPFALSVGKDTTIRVIAGTAAAPDFHGVVILSRPAILTGAAVAVNQDGTINSASNPAKLGAVVAIWGTGVGAVFPAPTDGQVATAAQDFHCCYISVFVSTPADVLYSGAAPGIVAGVVQINFRVPADLSIRALSRVPITLALFPPALNVPAPSTAWIYVTP